jgi:hypothetical protein
MAQTPAEKLQALKDALPFMQDNTLISKTKQLIRDLETQVTQSMPATSTGATTAGTPASSSAFQQAILSTLQMLMKSGTGTGVDSAAVRDLIEKYLKTDKVKLNELDQSILDEIKKNQIVKLEIPNFPKPITVGKDVAEIPNFYNIIDDVLAGNNVYLIGEAGGGKTFTAVRVSETLNRLYVTLNCSQYTSPLEILGGQSVDGFKQGKLVDCWKNGKILILDEMPKLDPNTAGLLNDALAKSTKTKLDSTEFINSADADEPPIQRNKDFAVIATGNIYPNEAPPPQYRGNNQQDLSLLDRFSGSVYYTEFDEKTDQKMTRYKFLYKFLVGNYYDYIKAKKQNTQLPEPDGLRTWIEHLGLKSLALVSYRTITSFRVGFEYELVRAIARKAGSNVQEGGKTLANTFDSYLVAFRGAPDTINTLITQSKYDEQYVKNLAEQAIKEITKNDTSWLDSLNPKVRETADPQFARYTDFYAINTTVAKSNAN